MVDDGYFTIVLNTNPYTYLGNRPLAIAPDAGLDQPLVSVTMRTLAFRRFAPILLEAVAAPARLQRSRWVSYRTGVTEMIVSGHGPFPYQVDGDHLGDATLLTLKHEPEILKLVLP